MVVHWGVGARFVGLVAVAWLIGCRWLPGVVHANVGQKLLKSNIFKSSDDRSSLSTFH